MIDMIGLIEYTLLFLIAVVHTGIIIFALQYRIEEEVDAPW